MGIEDWNSATSGDEEGGYGHVPVLLDRVLDVLSLSPTSKVFDGTVGMGGHASAILSRVASRGFLVGMDRDAEALEVARARLSRISSRFHLHRGVFTRIGEALSAAGIDSEGGLDGILLDLGVSSCQLDTPRRGFSFSRDGPLDMRMSAGEGTSAFEWLQAVPVDELRRVIRELGEELAAARIARAIDRRRRVAPIRTTGELAAIVEAVVPRGARRIHPATRTFQAIRIAVNRELELLDAFLRQADRYLAPGGRLVVLSYHSLEDRRVKSVIRERVREGLFERVRPECLRPDAEEIRGNPRARSARLRWAIRAG